MLLRSGVSFLSCRPKGVGRFISIKTKTMNKKLYVGNLSYDTSEDKLKEYFAQAGDVASVSIITDKYSGKSRGFGFVEMETEDEAKKAKEMFDQQELDGRKLVVNEARPRRNRSDR